LGAAVLIGGVTAAGNYWNIRFQSNRWVESLAQHADWSVEIEPTGWISVARYVRRRDGVIRILLYRAGKMLRIDAHLYDLGLSESISIDLLGDHPVSDGSAGAATVEKLEASEAVTTALRKIRFDRGTVERLEIIENMLVLEAVQRSGLEDERLSTVEAMFHAFETLGSVIIDVLELQEPPPGCPLCEGARLIADVGHLKESVCSNCHGRLLDPAGVQRVFGEELGMGPGDLKAGLSDACGLRCPGCRTRMGPLLLDDKILDLCPGCGSMWLDKGELLSISNGHYEEILGPLDDSGGG